MKKYKLLKDLPDHSIGSIRTEAYWIKWFKDHNFSNQIDNKYWFEEIDSFSFLTEEGTTIYRGEKSYYIHLGSKDIDECYDTWKGDSSTLISKYFSNRDNALEYLNKLKWKNKLKFKVGDKIKTNNGYHIVLKCDFLRELYVVKDSKSDNEDAIFFKDQDNFEFYLEIGKWYECDGDYMCYQGNNKDYGICKGMWIQGDWIYHENWKLADPKEVKRLLIEKAKKDYPVGTKVNLLSCAIAKDIATIEFDKYHYGTIDGEYIICNQRNKLKTNSRDFFIYNNGEWAEIVEKPIHKNPDGKFVYKSSFKCGDIIFHDSTKYKYITRFNSFTRDKVIGNSAIILTTKEYEYKYVYRNPVIGEIRKATQAEKEWFEKCERLGKYIPQDFKENKFPTITDLDFKIGDKVKIIDEKEQYCNFKEVFEALEFNKHSYDYNAVKGSHGYIINIVKHPYFDRTLIAIQLVGNRGLQILMNKKGISLYKFTTENGIDRFIGDPFYSVNLRTLKLEYWEDDFTKIHSYRFKVSKETDMPGENVKYFSTLSAAKEFIKTEKIKKFDYNIGDKLWNTVTGRYRGEIVDLYLDSNNNLMCNTDFHAAILLERKSSITNKVCIVAYNEEEYRFLCSVLNKKFFPKPKDVEFRTIGLSINASLVNPIKFFEDRNYLILTVAEYYQSLK